ncbi:MAG: DUF4157 domain-containing protein, partial [Pseudomonadota bacterium]
LERFFATDLRALRFRRLPAGLELGCLAFAMGSVVYLSRAALRLSGDAFEHLIAHEVTHCLQQRAGRVGGEAFTFNDSAELEREADRAAYLFLRNQPDADRALRRIVLDRLVPAAAPSAPVAQAVIYFVVEPMNFTTKADGQNPVVRGTYSKESEVDGLWDSILNDNAAAPIIRRLTDDEQTRAKTKLKHWVKAPMNRSYAAVFAKKGHAKQYRDRAELAQALAGRVTSRGSKQIEAALAQKVASSDWVKSRVSMFIQDLSAYMYEKGSKKFTDRGRYAYFYSSWTSAVYSKNARTTNEAVRHLLRNNPKTYQMAAFLADVSMVIRGMIPESVIPFYIEQGNARATHFSLDEANDWVKRARQAHVRLGAGPSATTMQVLRMVKYVRQWGRNKKVTANANFTPADQRTMLAVALALFEFWNSHANQKRGEIHTWHEVMVVAHGYGCDLETSGTFTPNSPLAEFEYPNPQDIPG